MPLPKSLYLATIPLTWLHLTRLSLLVQVAVLTDIKHVRFHSLKI